MNAEVLKQLSSYIGRLNSTNSTVQQVRYIMKQIRKKSKLQPPEQEQLYFQTLIDTLVDMIHGESLHSFYYFDGSENSYIRLQNLLQFPSTGFYWVGDIRLEKTDQGKKQFIFSFLKIKEKKEKGIELYVENGKLIYRIVSVDKSNNTQDIVIEKSEIKQNRWHHITLSHQNKELIIILDDNLCSEINLPFCPFANSYNFAIIGASTNSATLNPQMNFIGEMSTLYFFNSNLKGKKQDTDKKIWELNSFKEDQIEENRPEDINKSIYMAINPKVFSIIMF